MKKKDISKLLNQKGTELKLDDIAKYNLVEIADALLKAVIVNSKILEKKKEEMTKEDIQKGKLVLGHLNALIKAFGTKMQQIKLDKNIDVKIKKIKELKRKGHFK
ncbi:MAG: hypothetical protein ACTSR2_00765 [Candidatus Hodarchaeales archaeon]